MAVKYSLHFAYQHQIAFIALDFEFLNKMEMHTKRPASKVHFDNIIRMQYIFKFCLA